MAFLSFFKKTSNQRFEYNPRYWDPQKEDLHKRVEQAKRQSGNDPEAIKARISASMRRGGSGVEKKVRTNYMYRSNMMLIGIVVILLLLTYLFFVSYLPMILEGLGVGQGL